MASLRRRGAHSPSVFRRCSCVVLSLALSRKRMDCAGRSVIGRDCRAWRPCVRVFNGRSERAYGERLARSGLLHEQRLTANVQVAGFLERQRLFLITTERGPAGCHADEAHRLRGRGWPPRVGFGSTVRLRVVQSVVPGRSLVVKRPSDWCSNRAHRSFTGGFIAYSGFPNPWQV